MLFLDVNTECNQHKIRGFFADQKKNFVLFWVNIPNETIKKMIPRNKLLREGRISHQSLQKEKTNYDYFISILLLQIGSFSEGWWNVYSGEKLYLWFHIIYY